MRSRWSLLGVSALALLACREPPAREVRVVMGTAAEVRAVGLKPPVPGIEAAFAALTRVDEALTLWKESELTRLNAAGAAEVSPDLLAVLRRALEVAEASGGAFDPTVEPLVRAAGHLGGTPRELPDDERRALLARVGAQRVHVDPARPFVRMEPGTRLDFGGIAKGYAVDLAMAELRRAGALKALVNLGGSSLAVFGEPLTVAVRDPEAVEGPRWASFTLSEAALGTAGGDQRPGHIFDPRTGVPARKVLAATVVTPSAMEADALDTAVYVLGPEEGLALLARRGSAGFVLLREGGRKVLRATPGFTRAYSLEAAPDVQVRE
jgi:thiamine biosynthesis lipoprotein